MAEPDELTRIIAQHLEVDHQYVEHVEAWNTEHIATVRSAGRKAGRLLGWKIFTYQSRPDDENRVTVIVCVREGPGQEEDDRLRGTGQPWTVRDQVYASMGITPRQSLFETGSGKPEAPEPRRVIAYGDPDDPEAGKALMMPDRDLAARLGLAGPTADDARRTGPTGWPARRSAGARPAATWRAAAWKATGSRLSAPQPTRPMAMARSAP
jgi:hypothetical protein